MTDKKKRIFSPGDNLSIYLKKDLPPHFFEWLNKHDDITAFFLLALERLYAQNGNHDYTNEIPRKFNFEHIPGSRQPLEYEQLLNAIKARQTYEQPTQNDEFSTIEDNQKSENIKAYDDVSGSVLPKDKSLPL